MKHVRYFRGRHGTARIVTDAKRPRTAPRVDPEVLEYARHLARDGKTDAAGSPTDKPTETYPGPHGPAVLPTWVVGVLRMAVDAGISLAGSDAQITVVGPDGTPYLVPAWAANAIADFSTLADRQRGHAFGDSVEVRSMLVEQINLARAWSR